MNNKKYRQLRALIAFFVGAMVSVAVTRDSYLLATASVLTGLVFMSLVRSRAKVRTDERETSVQEKAARLTYAIFTPTIGLVAFFLLLPSKGNLTIFSRGEWLFLEALGMVFAYLTLFLIALYSIAYHFFNRKYGGSGDEE